MTTGRNTPPAHIWEALRRLRSCNRTQLAEALGVTRQTLHRWEQETEAGGDPGRLAEATAGRLLIATLRAARGADRFTRQD